LVAGNESATKVMIQKSILTKKLSGGDYFGMNLADSYDLKTGNLLYIFSFNNPVSKCSTTYYFTPSSAGH